MLHSTHVTHAIISTRNQHNLSDHKSKTKQQHTKTMTIFRNWNRKKYLSKYIVNLKIHCTIIFYLDHKYLYQILLCPWTLCMILRRASRDQCVVNMSLIMWTSALGPTRLATSTYTYIYYLHVCVEAILLALLSTVIFSKKDYHIQTGAARIY